MTVLRHQNLRYRRLFSPVQLTIRIISSTLKGYSIRGIALSPIRYASAGLIHERAKQINAVNETENRAARTRTRHTPLKRNEFRFRALSYRPTASAHSYRILKKSTYLRT